MVTLHQVEGSQAHCLTFYQLSQKILAKFLQANFFILEISQKNTLHVTAKLQTGVPFFKGNEDKAKIFKINVF